MAKIKKPLNKIDFSKYVFDKEKGIWSNYWKKWLTGSIGKDGYAVVELKNKDGSKNFYHYNRVMAYVFIEKPEEYKNIPFEELEVNHKNEKRSDNRVCNLEWCDRPYNVNYGNGNAKRSAANKMVTHTEEWNEKVAEALKKPVVQIEDDGSIIFWDCISDCEDRGFSKGAVSQCCNNKYHLKCKNHRRYKHSEWYFLEDYEKMLGEKNS